MSTWLTSLAMLGTLCGVARGDSSVTMPSFEKRLAYANSLISSQIWSLNWFSKFDTNDCPEYELPPVKPQPGCPLKKLSKDLQLLVAFRRCDLNPSLADCVTFAAAKVAAGRDIAPNCTETPEVCSPPLLCDWPSNAANSTLCPQNAQTCLTETTSPQCTAMTKCDLDTYKNSANCTTRPSCSSVSEVCLDVCDTDPSNYADECFVENCYFFPNAKGCSQLSLCGNIANCPNRNSFLTNQKCCVGAVCSIDCLTPKGCDPTIMVPGPETCNQAYAAGQTLTEIYAVAQTDGLIDEDTLSDVLACYVNITYDVVIPMDKKCFDEGVLSMLDEIDNDSDQSTGIDLSGGMELDG